MKKLLKISLSTALAFLLFGSILFAFGYSSGALDDLDTTPTLHTRKEVTLEHIDTLDLNLDNQNLIIEETTADKPRLVYNKQAKEKITYQLTNGKLRLTQISKQPSINFIKVSDFKWLSSKSRKTSAIHLYIPKKTKLKQTNISASAGDISIKKQQIAKISIEQDVGTLSISDSTLANGSISTSLGDTSIENSQLSNLHFEADTGAFTATNISILNTFSIDNNMGNVAISLAADNHDKTTVSAETDLGDVTIDPSLKKGGKRINHLNITTDTGDITVK